MQKNIFLSIILIIISIVVLAFAMTTYRYYQAIHSDDPISPYLSVERGQATIIRGDLAIDMTSPESYDVQEGDTIVTRADSQAVIAWPDHSTTRLGADSRLTIEKMRVALDYSRIELVASLEEGKAWSNIVRTLYPDSRIEFYIPKYGTVAGVRGTVFEINLENNYIHSVDHSVMLQNSIGQLVTLLPGDAVQVNNIFSKIITGLDTAWISLNSLQDNTYMSLRNTKLRDNYTLLAGKATMTNIWDNFVRWILGWFASFQDIALIASINSGDLTDMATMPQVLVMKWYQSLQSADFIQERDQFRGVIMSWKDNLQNGDQLIENLTKGAIWDMSTLSGATLQNTQKLLDAYAQKTGTTLDMLISGLRQIDSSTITEGARAIYEKLMR